MSSQWKKSYNDIKLTDSKNKYYYIIMTIIEIDLFS